MCRSRGGDTSARKPGLFKLRFNVIGGADRAQRVLVQDAVLIGAPRPSRRHPVVFYIRCRLCRTKPPSFELMGIGPRPPEVGIKSAGEIYASANW
jgi:hypothetical protein